MSTPTTEGEGDRITRWDGRTLDLLAAQGVALVGVACSDCHRVRPLESVWTSRETHAHHCFDRADCAATVARNNAGGH